MGQFYGYTSANIRDANGLTPRAMYDLLSQLWCAKTCAPRMRKDWSAQNPSLGQCSITAFLAQDVFGGSVLGVPLGDGNYHCFNAVGDCVFDLTSEQFGDRTQNYANASEQRREAHFQKAEKLARYRLLRQRFFGAYAVLLKHGGYNCCQAVLCAFANETEMNGRALGAAFGVGMGCMEATCGALIGAQLLLGERTYAGKPILKDARALLEAFQAACGATQCRALKGIDTGTVLCECDDCVKNAVAALEAML